MPVKRNRCVMKGIVKKYSLKIKTVLP